MSQPFYGEIRLVAYTFAPVNWAKCDGALLNISENTALFSLLGTQFGGDGRTTYALPDLRGRTPIHPGSYVDNSGSYFYSTGNVGGAETVTLTANTMPAHSHYFYGSGDDNELADSSFIYRSNQTNNGLAQNTSTSFYANATPNVGLAVSSISAVGGGASHDNIQPSLSLLFTIALHGLYPPRN